MLIFIISYIQSFFPPERTKRILGTFHGIGANILAALLGTVTPLLFLFFHSSFYWIYKCRITIRSYIQFPYFISMVDIGSLVLLMSIFGTKVAVVYVLLGLVIAVVGGTLIEKTSP